MRRYLIMLCFLLLTNMHTTCANESATFHIDVFLAADKSAVSTTEIPVDSALFNGPRSPICV
jgi:hypothetical protein